MEVAQLVTASLRETAGVSSKGDLSLTDKAETVPDLIALANALDAMVSVASALTSARRMRGQRGTLNAAGSEMDDLTDILVDRHVAVIDRLREARAATESEAEDRACALLRWDLECDQDATDVALAAVRKAFPGRY